MWHSVAEEKQSVVKRERNYSHPLRLFTAEDAENTEKSTRQRKATGQAYSLPRSLQLTLLNSRHPFP